MLETITPHPLRFCAPVMLHLPLWVSACLHVSLCSSLHSCTRCILLPVRLLIIIIAVLSILQPLPSALPLRVNGLVFS